MYAGRSLDFAEKICSEVNKVCRPLPLFKELLQYGYYPFYLKNQIDYYTSIEPGC